jgi:hypothetical protein
MISAMAANGALRCPDIIYCSSSLQISTDHFSSLTEAKKKKTPQKRKEKVRVQATVVSRGKNREARKRTYLRSEGAKYHRS